MSRTNIAFITEPALKNKTGLARGLGQGATDTLSRGKRNYGDHLRQFVRDQDGSVTVEFVLWFPIVMSLVLAMADVSVILFERSNTLRIVEDAHRMRSIGVLTSDEVTKTHIITKLGGAYTGAASVQSSVKAGVQTTVVILPIDNVDMLGIFTGLVGNATIAVRSQQFIEDFGV